MKPSKTNASKKKPKKPKKSSPSALSPNLPVSKSSTVSVVPLGVVHPHAAAIDVHSDNHVVCVGPNQVETFGAYTVDLQAIADYLKQHGVTSVVLESTGVYWIPLFELLEAQGFETFLIEPSQADHCGARPKTDVLAHISHQRC